MRMTGNTILITGGGTGIGLALSDRLLAEGNRVIICGRRRSILERAKSALPQIATFHCDVVDPEDRSALADWLEREFPEVNILINNAGIQKSHTLSGSTAHLNISEEIAVNFMAPIELTNHLLPLLRGNANAMIANVTSALAFAPLADVPIYCATKAAMHIFTLCLRHQLRDINVRVVEIAPPLVESELNNERRGDRLAGPQPISPSHFADQVFAQLQDERDEILIGAAAYLRAQGEAIFRQMNAREHADSRDQ